MQSRKIAKPIRMYGNDKFEILNESEKKETSLKLAIYSIRYISVKMREGGI